MRFIEIQHNTQKASRAKAKDKLKFCETDYVYKTQFHKPVEKNIAVITMKVDDSITSHQRSYFLVIVFK